jgi:hypothetical protein
MPSDGVKKNEVETLFAFDFTSRILLDEELHSAEAIRE